MPTKHLTLALRAPLFCAVCLSVGAASPRYSIRTWETDDGLPQNSVLAMTQTRDGYLWLGTGNGLARFDGIHFTLFNEGNTPELKSNQITKLFEDSQGNLWIGTEMGGILLVNKQGKVSSVDLGRGSPAGHLMAICEDSSGTVWLYTADGQLARYRDKRVDVWNAGAGFPSKCRLLAVEDSGLLWVGTEQTLTAIGPLPMSMGVGLPVAHEMAAKLDFVLARKRGGYWRLADGRVQQWKTNRLERDFGLYPWPGSPLITAACEDPQGNLVVGTYGEGVYWFDDTGKAMPLEGLTNSYVASLIVDREGTLWVGTDSKGLKRVKRQIFDVLKSSEGATPQSLCPDGRGGLWIGYNSQRIDHWIEDHLEQFAVRKDSVNLAVRSVLMDRNQTVWAGTYGGGLFELLDGRFAPVADPRVFNAQISALYQDARGLLWLGTQAGLVRWDGHQWNAFTITNAEHSAANIVRALADDSKANFWLGTQAGLIRLSPPPLTFFTKTSGLPSDNISSLLIDADGILWVGTARGLARFEQGRFTSYSAREGLGENIGYLLEDGLGYLWIGSTAGLKRVEKRALNEAARNSAYPVPVRLYGKADGLPIGECSQGSQPAACRTSDGKLWFPTIEGLAAIDPAQLKPNTNPPPVIIQAALLDRQMNRANTLRAPEPAEITIPAGKESLEIRFTSLNLAAPDKGSFKYLLEGYETVWTEVPATTRSVRYSKLPPAHYRFRLTACNEDGVWNLTGSSLAVVVLPPFWRTWWFLGATTLCLLTLIVGSVNYISTQRLQRQLAALRQQEALEKERARIARDLHDQLGANLTQVALLGEMAEGDKNSPAEVETHARQISQTARETTRALDEIVWTVNPANDTVDGLINYLCKYAQEYLAIAGLRYRLEAPPQLPNTPISPELRHNVFLAAKEAVNNVVKHAKASSAWLRLRFEDHHFVLEIEDDGAGVSPSDQNKDRNGLRNMRKRMEDIGGSFFIGSAGERGTIVRLTAPLRN